MISSEFEENYFAMDIICVAVELHMKNIADDDDDVVLGFIDRKSVV